VEKIGCSSTGTIVIVSNLAYGGLACDDVRVWRTYNNAIQSISVHVASQRLKHFKLLAWKWYESFHDRSDEDRRNWWIDELMNWWIDELMNWWIDELMKRNGRMAIWRFYVWKTFVKFVWNQISSITRPN
jgi:hypothetical protein